MWGLFSKQASEDAEWRGPHRVHVDQPSAAETLRCHVRVFLRRLHEPTRKMAVLCIGTDRSTGDCLGPLTGTRLTTVLGGRVKVLGTLDQPVHAVNLAEAMESLRAWDANPFIIAIDACLGRTESVGYISLKEGPLQPGTGVNKTLPAVGDFHIIGIVNVGGFMEYLVLQNTRLALVMRMAELITAGLHDELACILDVPAAAALDGTAPAAALLAGAGCTLGRVGELATSE